MTTNEVDHLLKATSAAEMILARREAASSFRGFVNMVAPRFTLAPFQEELIEALDALESRDLGTNCLLITMPPRHGKSWLASTLFPAYYMARDPFRHTLAVSYGADLAANFGRQVRDTCLEPCVNLTFPAMQMSKTSAAVDDWSTTEGGRYYACGVGGGTTGRPANLLLIDDPIKSRVEADSPSTRNKLWSYYNSALVNRKQPEFNGSKAIEVLIQTRWHPDDLAGRIMNSADWAEGDWTHINFPAIRPTKVFITTPATETEPETTEEQTVDTALWPERFSLADLEKMKRRDPREFAALYQQEPFISGGNLIKTQWFNTYTQSTLPDKFQTVIQTVDTAFTTKTTSDFSVITTFGLSFSGDIYILDVVRERLDYPSLKRRLLMETAKHRGRGLRGMYVEDVASGSTLLQEMKKTPGLSIIAYKIHGNRGKHFDKVTRLNAVLPLIEGGRVFIPEQAPWLDDFLEECQGFPSVKHDDQVDTLTMGLDVLSRVQVQTTDFADLSHLQPSLNSLASASSLDSLFNPSHSSRPNDYDDRHTNRFSNMSKPLGEL